MNWFCYSHCSCRCNVMIVVVVIVVVGGGVEVLSFVVCNEQTVF